MNAVEAELEIWRHGAWDPGKYLRTAEATLRLSVGTYVGNNISCIITGKGRDQKRGLLNLKMTLPGKADENSALWGLLHPS